jgi:hypothetical protein
MRERPNNIIRPREEDPSFLPDYVLRDRVDIDAEGMLPLPKPKPTRSGKPQQGLLTTKFYLHL